jgi:acyl-phosphate glycerol 3-phosphate acyltransferase
LGFLVIIAAYALGSVLFGVLLGRLLFGDDLRARDNPGGSGSFRQYGPIAGIAVGLLDLGKGAAAVLLAGSLGLDGYWVATSAAAVVAGHNWPLWYGFRRGGGGLAPAVGAMAVLAPEQLAWALAAALAAAAAYRLIGLRRRFKIAALPAGSMIGLPLLVFLVWQDGNSIALLAAASITLLIGRRGLEMAREGPRRSVPT